MVIIHQTKKINAGQNMTNPNIKIFIHSYTYTFNVLADMLIVSGDMTCQQEEV